MSKVEKKKFFNLLRILVVESTLDTESSDNFTLDTDIQDLRTKDKENLKLSMIK